MYRAALSDHAADGLAELRKAHNVTPSDADVVRLNELGWRVDGESNAAAASVPYPVGNILLHPPTAMALQWYADHAAAFGTSRDLRLFAYAFALAHGRGLPVASRVLSWQERLCRRMLGVSDAVTLDQIQGYDAARRAVRVWMLTCTALLSEIDAAIGEMEDDQTLVGEARARSALLELFGYFADAGEDVSKTLTAIAEAFPSKEEREAFSWEAACHEMAACTGTDPAMWTRAPCAAVQRSYRAALRHAAMATGAGCEALDGTGDAVKAFRASVVEIIKRERASHAQT